MTHPLQQRIEDVSHRARRLEWTHAGGWFLALAAAALAAAAAIDWQLRLEDLGLRVLLTAAVIGAWCWLFKRLLWPVLGARRGHVAVARQVERRFPQLADQLSSAIEFLSQAETAGNSARSRGNGSASLRRAVVADAERQTVQLDLRQCLNSRPATAALWAAGCVAAALLASVLANPADAGRAARRLAAPWGGPSWPRQNQLVYRAAPQLASRGDDVVVRVADNHQSLPDWGTGQLWHAGDQPGEIQSVEIRREADELLFRINNVSRPLRYRVLAGDDQTDWVDLELVEPPRILQWEVLLTPPACLNRQPETVSGRLEALLESRVEVRAKISAAAPRAWLVTSFDQRLEMAASDDQQSFRLDSALWRLDAAGTFEYWLEVEDPTGRSVAAGRRWTGVVRADPPPSVSLELPHDGLKVTPAGLLPLEGVVKDNAGIRSITLTALLSDGRQIREPLSTPAPSASGDAPLAVRLQQTWPLENWQLQPGDTLDLQVEAEDQQPQTGASELRRVQIVSIEEMQLRTAEQQAAIYAQLKLLIRFQQQTHQRTKSANRALGDALQAGDQEMLQNLELQQRRVSSQLATADDSLLQSVLALQQRLERNRVEAPAQQLELGKLSQQLNRLAENQAEQAVRCLATASREARQSDDGAAVRQQLDQASSAQSELLQALQQLLAEADRWSQFEQLVGELSQLRSRQSQIAAAAADLQLAALAQADPAATRQQAQRLARQQQDLALELDAALQRIAAVAQQLPPQDRMALTQAGQLAIDQAISSRMRDASAQLLRQQFGQASQSHQHLLDSLEQVLTALQNANNPSAAATGSGPQQPAWQQQVAALRERQQRLLEQTQSLSPEAAGAQADRQQQLNQQASELFDSWAEHPALQLGLQGALQPMQQAVQFLRQLDPPLAAAAQRTAVAKLGRLLEALEPSEPAPPPASSQATQTPAGRPQQPGADQGSPLLLAELKIIAQLQTDVLERTESLDRVGTQRPLSVTEISQQRELAQTQAKLAEMIGNIATQFDEPADEAKPGPPQPKSSIDQLQNLLEGANP